MSLLLPLGLMLVSKLLRVAPTPIATPSAFMASLSIELALLLLRVSPEFTRWLSLSLMTSPAVASLLLSSVSSATIGSVKQPGF